MVNMSNRNRLSSRPNFTQRILQIGAAGITVVGLAAALFFYIESTEEESVDCESCTISITGTSNTSYTVTSGDVVCIEAGATYSGTIQRNGNSGNGTVVICNRGNIQNASLRFNKGINIIHNYGTLSPNSLQFNSGTSENTVTNYSGATATFSSFQLSQNGTSFINAGEFSSGQFSLGTGASFENQEGATGSSGNLQINNDASWVNQGTFTTNGNFSVNSNGEATNLGTLTILGNLESNHDFMSIGYLTVAGNLRINGNSSMDLEGWVDVGGDVEVNKNLNQAGQMEIGGNFTVNGGAKALVAGLIDVDGNLTNNSRISGPDPTANAYGRINVAGNTTQNGGGSMTNLLDVCDAGYPATGLDTNWGNKDATVTHCVNSPQSSFPVEWLSFDAHAKGPLVELSWSTARESNNDFFTVERSVDAVQFEEVAKISAVGNTEAPTSYQALDANPPIGRIYYRIRQTDFDGQTSFTNRVELSMESEGFAVNLYPNPATERINLDIRTEQGDAATVSIRSIDGREVLRQPLSLVTGLNHQEFSLQQYPAGTYLLQVLRSNGTLPTTIRFNKY